MSRTRIVPGRDTFATVIAKKKKNKKKKNARRGTKANAPDSPTASTREPRRKAVQAFVVVKRGWSVRFRYSDPTRGDSFVAYGEAPIGRMWFQTRKAARTYIKEAATHSLYGGFVVRATLTFEAEGH